MRLMTFQDRNCLHVLEDGEWFSRRDHRLKLVDYDYADEDKGIYPIYAFASFGLRENPYFGLPQFYRLQTFLAGYMRFDLESRVMVELEVPESFILNMKENGKWFEVKCDNNDPDKELRRRDNFGKWHWLKRDLSDGTIYNSNYLDIVRSNQGTTFEAVIPSIKMEHIAAIREFKVLEDNYGDTVCKTIYANASLCPLWYGDIITNGDSYPRFDKVKDADILKTISEIKANGKYPFEEYIAQDKYGAMSVPGYFTISEALACCNKDIKDKIMKDVEYCKIDRNDFDSVVLSNCSNIYR